MSVRTIYTRRREQLYWAAILSSCALGTAFADVLEELGLWYLLAAAH